MRNFAITIIFLMMCAATERAAALPNAFGGGPVELRHALTFYIVNEADADFVVNLRWRDGQQIHADRPRLIRVFDPQERLIVKQLESCERVEQPQQIPQYEIDVPVKARGAGVYQVIITGFGGSSHFATTPPLPWGVFGYPRLVAKGNQFADARIFLPPGLDNFSIRCEGKVDSLRLTDENGQSQIDARGPSASGQAALPQGGNRVWRLSISAPENDEPYRIDFAGAPIILCPDETTARTIRGSIDVLPDGTICFHKFQVRAHEILRRYRQLPARHFAVNLQPLDQYRSAWLAQPARNDLLLGGYGVIANLPLVLGEQNLDATSPWFGTMKVWHDGPRQAAKSDNPWTRTDRLNLSRVAAFNNVLASVYSINQPFNPLHRDSALHNRIVIAALQELMLLREQEMPVPIIPDEFWGGERAFTFSSFLHAFPLFIDDCPADVRETIVEGLRRYVDRESISQVASTTNQWSYIIKGLRHFYDGVREPEYQKLIERHLHWMLTRNQWDLGHMPAGYFFENGPDATYNGIAAHNFAWVFRQMTRGGQSDAATALGAALRDCFNLFNHTIAPQPDGSLVGASNFATRTAGNWSQPQHGAGVAMLSGQFSEAAPLVGRVWPTIRAMDKGLTTQRANEQALIQRLAYITDESEIWRNADMIAAGPEIHFMIWQHFADAPLNGRLPIVARDDFTQVFGDEFLCVRRPRYYSFIYAGKPMPEFTRNTRPLDPRQQHPRNGGGLSMFWSPAFGASLLAQNWAAYSANTIVVERKAPGGIRADWEDYWSIEHAFDADRATATVSGSIRDQPLTFERQYRFLDIGVECNLNLRATGAATYAAAWECFPYPADLQTRMHVALVDEEGRPVNKRPASAIVFRNASNEAHVIVFSGPRECDIGSDRVVDHHGKNREYNRVLAAIPTEWSAGQQHTLRWCIMVVPAAEVPRSIRAAISAMAK